MSNDAIHHPVKRQYNRKEVHTSDMPLQADRNIDIGDDFERGGESIAIVEKVNSQYLEDLAFAEEAVTIRIDDNSRSELPQTHIPCWVNGREAEVFDGAKWMRIGWLPIGIPITTRRKYVEVLMRSKPESVRTIHDDATVERPRNTLNIQANRNYPMTIIQDTPKGHEWASRILAEG